MTRRKSAAATSIATRPSRNWCSPLAAALRALAPGPDGKPDPAAIARFLNAGPFPDVDRSLLEWPGWMRAHAPREPCNPVDLDKLAAIVSAAVDPTVPRPP